MSTASLTMHSYMRQSCTRLEYTDAFSGVCLLFVETNIFELPAAKSSTGYEGGARTITTTPHFAKQWYTGEPCPAHQHTHSGCCRRLINTANVRHKCSTMVVSMSAANFVMPVMLLKAFWLCIFVLLPFKTRNLHIKQSVLQPPWSVITKADFSTGCGQPAQCK